MMDSGKMLEYKGYFGTVEYSEADNVLHGKVMGIKGLISYEGISLEALTGDFQDAVDFYIETCHAENRQPQIPAPAQLGATLV
jgi:predicted HicB family RNase H-like nuclease